MTIFSDRYRFFSSTTKKCTARTVNHRICVWMSTYIHKNNVCKEGPKMRQ